ncbi:MAG: YbgA family protein [Thermodesulfobacteriota bacterium]
MNKPLVGVSTCLLGENVRYDGGHKLDRYLKETLGRYVDYVPVCPETECGLGVPREAVRLVDIDGEIRLMTQKTGVDVTDQMKRWAAQRLEALSGLPLCGYVFKSKSPSSGLYRIKVYQTGGGVKNDGTGLFAGLFVKRFPLVPVEEEGRLNDPQLRENFIERIFVMQRWYDLTAERKTVSRLMAFHAAHKYLLMTHCQQTLKKLGALVAEGKKHPAGQLYDLYIESLMPALAKIATPRKNTNVLLHIMGYFKKELAPDEKAELKEIIDRYYSGQVPLVVPLTLINHYARKHRPAYLMDQIYLNPHPLELMLRNHV